MLPHCCTPTAHHPPARPCCPAGVCVGGGPAGPDPGQQGLPGAPHHAARGAAGLGARRGGRRRRLAAGAGLPPRLRGGAGGAGAGPGARWRPGMRGGNRQRISWGGGDACALDAAMPTFERSAGILPTYARCRMRRRPAAGAPASRASRCWQAATPAAAAAAPSRRARRAAMATPAPLWRCTRSRHWW